MEEFKVKAISSAPHPHLWLRFVDDTIVIQQAKHSQQLLQNINSQDPHIPFTTEEPKQEGTLPFLHTVVSSSPNNTLATTVYRKPTDTNQYLHWDSNHFITAQNSVFTTFACRANVVCSSQLTLQQEMVHIRKALLECSLPPWALISLHTNFNHKHTKHNTQTTTRDQQNTNNKGSNNKDISIVVAYTKGLREKFKKTCNSMGIEVHSKATIPSEPFSWPLRTKTTNAKKVVIYRFKYPHVNCPEEYVQESGRSFGDTLKEHLRAPSPIHHHSHTTGHLVNLKCFIIVDKES